jgi:hypothetical protein
MDTKIQEIDAKARIFEGSGHGSTICAACLPQDQTPAQAKRDDMFSTEPLYASGLAAVDALPDWRIDLRPTRLDKARCGTLNREEFRHGWPP